MKILPVSKQISKPLANDATLCSAKPSENKLNMDKLALFNLYRLPALKGKFIGEITKDDLKSVLAEKLQNLGKDIS